MVVIAAFTLLVSPLRAAIVVAPHAGDSPTRQLIVKFRSDVDAPRAAMAVHDRVALLAAETGVDLSTVRPMALGGQVVALAKSLPLAQAQAIAERIAAHADVLYAEPDRRVYPLAVPNDPLVSQQSWYLGGSAVGINAFGAWDITVGSGSTVVAVVDSGYRPHPDLAGRILPGYDFISDIPTANDGDGRDPDASDPGDWISQADLDGAFKGSGCPIENSSWHGTGVASIIAADSNNGLAMAGINWAAKILPVRVLGKCGGLTSDVTDAIAWAGGISVPGVPANPTPAHIINLSFGGDGACSFAEQNAINEVLAKGVTRAVVVAGGNGAGSVANSDPANCGGVIAVAATTTSGSRASYSNFGAGITISAPGGDTPLTAGPPANGIVVLDNLGTTVPGADALAYVAGTSAAAPVVAGVISLMLSVAPNLTAAQVRAALIASAQAFPAGSTCTTAICGAGIVNALGAVQAAQAIGGPAVDLNQHGLTGSWYKPSTSGQGVEVEVFPDQLAPGAGQAFVSWFTYDTVAGGADHQRWYTLSGPVVSGQPNAALTIYQNTGGNFNAPPVTSAQPVGTATLSFDTCSSGRLAYSFSDGTGRTGAIALTRLTQNVTCSTATPHPANADFALSGNWYNGTTSGQGFTADVNPNSGQFFAAWYTYMPNGIAAGAAGQRWYTAQGAFTSGLRSIAVQIFETTGGVFDTVTPPGQQTVSVGTGTMTFQSCSAATFNYAFTGGTSRGLSGTIALSRVGPLPPGCTS